MARLDFRVPTPFEACVIGKSEEGAGDGASLRLGVGGQVREYHRQWNEAHYRCREDQRQDLPLAK